jgi:hypothetical protein
VVSYDEINRERTRGLAVTSIPPDDWMLTEAEARQQIAVLLTAGHSVIYDHVNFIRQQREELRALAALHGAATQVIWVDVPADIATAQWQHNRVTGLRFDVRDEDFAIVLSMFEPPTADEAPLRYDGSLPLDAWVISHVMPKQWQSAGIVRTHLNVALR